MHFCQNKVFEFCTAVKYLLISLVYLVSILDKTRTDTVLNPPRLTHGAIFLANVCQVTRDTNLSETVCKAFN